MRNDEDKINCLGDDRGEILSFDPDRNIKNPSGKDTAGGSYDPEYRLCRKEGLDHLPSSPSKFLWRIVLEGEREEQGRGHPGSSKGRSQ